MNAQIIQRFKDDFVSFIQSKITQGEAIEMTYKWDVIASWKEHFVLDYPLLEKSVEQALNSNYSRSLWDGEKYSIKSGILMLIKENSIFMESAFQNLFDESKDISMRFNRFLYHCDELLETITKRDDRINTHYQTDYSVSLFLALEYPEKYGLFRYETFDTYMKNIESRNIPVIQDKERHYKIFNAIYTVISKDQEFMNGIQFLLQEAQYSGKSHFLINDMMEFVVNKGVC